MSFSELDRASRSNRTAMVLAALCVIGACKKNDGEAAPGGYAQGQVGVGAAAGAPATAPAQGGAPATAPAPTPAPATAGAPPNTTTTVPLPGASTVPAAPAIPPPQAGPTAVRLDATAAAAVVPILSGLTKDNVQSGAKPLGEPVVGNFGQNQKLEFPVQLSPNKCYTVVATGLPPVSEVGLQLELTTALPGLAPVLAVDSERGPTAVIGKKTQCYRWTLGVIAAPGKVVVQVTGGTGLVAAQVFEK
jgi:hypothetical protein